MKGQRVWTVRSCRSNGTTQFAPKLSSKLESISLLVIVKQVHVVKHMAFPVVMFGCESWNIKNNNNNNNSWVLKSNTFELCCWRRLSRVPWTARRSNQSILKEVKPEYSLAGLMSLNIHWQDWCWSWSSNTSATWCEEVTHWKDPDAGKDWRQKEKGPTEDEMVGWGHWLDEHEFEQALGVGNGQGSLVCSSPWGHKELDMTKQLNYLWRYLFGRIRHGEYRFCHSVILTTEGFPVWLSWSRIHLQFRRSGLDLWVRKIPLRRKGQPTQVFFPRKSHGQRSMAGYSLWGRKSWTWLSD